MGIPDGAHNHGHGSGSGAGTVVLVVLAAMLAAAILPTLLVIVHALLIAAAVILGLAAAGLVALIAWRLRHRRAAPARMVATVTPGQPRAAQLRPEPQPAIGPRAIHLHFHGVDAADVAAIIRHQQEDQ